MSIRIDPKDLDSIIKAFKKCFSSDDHLWLFGSRVNDTKRGGDIDLYIEIKYYDVYKVFKARSCFWNLLQDLLGEQKIDIVVRDPKQELLVYKIARQEGVMIL